MEIHEYQAKELLTAFGVPVPKGGVAYSADQAVYRATEIGGLRWVVKAQIHAGARGKAGGIRLCSTDADVRVSWPGGETGPWLRAKGNEFAIVTRGAGALRRWSPDGS